MNRLLLKCVLALVSLVSMHAGAEVVEYEVLSVSSGAPQVIAKGRKEYAPRDIEVHPYVRDGQQIAEKLLVLEQNFKIGARIFYDKELTGFGLIAQQSDHDFSWEWFSKVTGNRFWKLQGGQYVEIQSAKSPIGEELAQIQFLEDTSLRFKPVGAAKDTHNIVVKAGSVLRLR